MKNFLLTFLTSVTLVAVSGPAKAATIIDFNSVPSSSNPVLTTLTTSGFTFTSNHFHTIDSPGITNFGGSVNNGTIYIAEEAGTIGAPITMSQTGGGTFQLSGFDGSRAFLNSALALAGGFPNADTIDVVGNVFGGGVVNASFSLNVTPSFATYLLPGNFVNLTSVVFSGSRVTGGTGAFSVDNIQVDPTAQGVPEPSTVLGAIAFTLLGLTTHLRRNRKAA